ncbi:MAG: thioesterase family protein [candidate division NC10 bacterium]|nr:thioesterase family protein [candidate division NC10 bacterium]
MEVTKGQTGEIERMVTKEEAASRFGNQRVEVFATPVLVAWMEEAAIVAVHPHLEEGQGTVGTMVAVKHLAATPIGMRVKVMARVKEVDGRRLLFEVEAYDQKEKIAEGEHERFVVNLSKFLDKAAKKAQG